MFAHLPALYKLYAIRELPPRQERLDEDPSLDLLQQLLPALAEALTAIRAELFAARSTCELCLLKRLTHF